MSGRQPSTPDDFHTPWRRLSLLAIAMACLACSGCFGLTSRIGATGLTYVGVCPDLTRNDIAHLERLQREADDVAQQRAPAEGNPLRPAIRADPVVTEGTLAIIRFHPSYSILAPVIGDSFRQPSTSVEHRGYPCSMSIDRCPHDPTTQHENGESGLHIWWSPAVQQDLLRDCPALRSVLPADRHLVLTYRGWTMFGPGCAHEGMRLLVAPDRVWGQLFMWIPAVAAIPVDIAIDCVAVPVVLIGSLFD
jgi:hypothetical protein